MPTILVLHGPNMALKGVDEVDESLELRASELGVELAIHRANSEGLMLDALLEARADVDGVVVNPGALAPAVWALAEALTLLQKPAVEVLLESSPRGPSALTGVVAEQIHDRGAIGYVLALEYLAKVLPADAAKDAEAEPEEATGTAPRSALRAKTIGRRSTSRGDAEATSTRPSKTIGRRPAAATPPPSGASQSSHAGAPAAGLTRAQVRARVSARLAGSATSDELAAWARHEWSLLQKGAPCESGHRELLESVLLTLMGGPRTSEHVLLAQLAKLE